VKNGAIAHLPGVRRKATDGPSCRGRQPSRPRMWLSGSLVTGSDHWHYACESCPRRQPSRATARLRVRSRLRDKPRRRSGRGRDGRWGSADADAASEDAATEISEGARKPARRGRTTAGSNFARVDGFTKRSHVTNRTADSNPCQLRLFVNETFRQPRARLILPVVTRREGR